jgi:hypothetical protein
MAKERFDAEVDVAHLSYMTNAERSLEGRRDSPLRHEYQAELKGQHGPKTAAIVLELLNPPVRDLQIACPAESYRCSAADRRV